MSLTAILLVLLSASIHAGWNLISKRQHPSAAFFLIAALSGGLFLAPVLWVHHEVLFHQMPLRVWIYIGITGAFLALYFSGLAGAYRSGDMSVAYPIARSSPVIVVLAVAIVLGRGDQVSTVATAGLFVVVAGCFLIPLRHFRDFNIVRYWNPTCAFALLAALATAGYSITDDEALRLLRSQPDFELGTIQSALLYGSLEFISASLWLAIFIGFRKKERDYFRKVCCKEKRIAMASGLAIVLSYIFILMAFSHADNVSYVVGLRQLSIPLGALIAVVFLGEPANPPKWTGVCVMFLGLVMVAMG